MRGRFIFEAAILAGLPCVFAWLNQAQSKVPSSFLYNSYLENLEGDSKNEDASLIKERDSGYKFGDITKGVLGKFQTGVNSITGNEKYNFGDLTKWIDAQAKAGAVKIDKAIKDAAMERATQYTKQPEYRFGDITREIIRRFEVGEYKKEDLWLFIRISILIGTQIVPMATATLPMKVLLELLEVSMASSVSEEITGFLTGEINNRMKDFITSDRTYQVGDLTKKMLLGNKPIDPDLSQQVVGKITGKEVTGKDVTDFGNFSKSMLLLITQRGMKKEKKPNEADQSSDTAILPIDAEESGTVAETETVFQSQADEMAALSEFEAWEKKYLASLHQHAQPSNVLSDRDYEICDEQLMASHSSARS